VAVVRPFRAITFSLEAGPDVSTRVAPPYDVVSASQRAALLERDPRDIIAIDLPAGGEDRYERAAATWHEWRKAGVLVDDRTPAFYVLEQRFTFRHQSIRRRALIAAVDLEPFDAGVVLPHERTLPKALDDRLALLRATAANLSQVFGLYSDPAGVTDDLLKPVRADAPLLTATDTEGVESRVWAIRDNHRRQALTDALSDSRIFIADGHHRYTTALTYRDERRASDGHEPWQPYDATMMALVNMDDPDLVVLPTHRVADAAGPFDTEAFLDSLRGRFDLTPAPDDFLVPLRDLAGEPRFIVALRDGRRYLAHLHEGVDLATEVPGDASDAWKSLDVAVLQELVLWPLLGIHPDHPETLERLSFVKGAEDALAGSGAHDVTFLLRSTRMDQLRAVSLAGELMPQKSTYFYPKLLSGLVMRDLAV
jgi:uncharacterized protein (DUF1015 family)